MNKREIISFLNQAKKFTTKFDALENLETKVSDRVDELEDEEKYSEELQELYNQLTEFKDAMESLSNIISDMLNAITESDD